MVVMATFDDDTTADVTNGCSFSPLTEVGEDVTVTVTYRGKTATFSVKVTEADKEEEPKIPMKTIIIIGAAVVGVIVIILIFAGVLKVNKKGKVTVNKKQVKKIVKGSSKKKK